MSLGLGLGLEGPSLDLGLELERLSLGLGLEGPSLGLGIDFGCLSLDYITANFITHYIMAYPLETSNAACITVFVS